MLKYYILLVVLSAFCITNGLAQELYQFKGATVVIELDYGDSIVQLQSRHLHVRLDNDNAEFNSILELKTLVNTADDYHANFGFLTDSEKIEMTGKFKVDHIETSNHAPLNFEFSGMLTQKDASLPIFGRAELQHIGGGGSFSCMLGYSFIIKQETLRLNNIGSAYLKEVKVQVLQTILNREG